MTGHPKLSFFVFSCKNINHWTVYQKLDGNNALLYITVTVHWMGDSYIPCNMTIWLFSLLPTFRQVDCVWNVLTHAQKPNFVFLRNGRVHLNRRGRQFSRLLAAEVCASAVVMMCTPCLVVVWRVLATHSMRQFPFHFPSRASPCAITFQLDCNTGSPALFQRNVTRHELLTFILPWPTKNW
jgi:hypothetical protein